MSQIRCYTCLQRDRKLSPLKAQVKFLFALLCPEMFIKTKDTAQYLICWECEFMADKIKRFQTRLKKANEVLEQSFKGKTTIMEGLSSLKVTAVETISLIPSQTAQILPQNVPENLPMLPKIVQSIPQNILELSLKDMLAIPIKVERQAEVKIEEEGHCSNDFDELIQPTTVLQVPIDESDPLLIPRLKQPSKTEVLPQKPVKEETIDPAINYIPQEIFIDPPKEQIEYREFREPGKVTFEDPNLEMGIEINPVLVNKNPVIKSKKNDELLAKLLSTPSKCEELFLMRQRVPNSYPQKESEYSERSGIDRQHVPNSNPPKESDNSEQNSGVASEKNEVKMVILNRSELNVHRNKKKSNPAYMATSFRCEKCIEWFHSQEKLDEHNLKHDDKSRGNSICEICEQRFADDSLREKHYKQHFIVYECHKCPCRYSNRIHLSAHCRMKHEESTFVCKKCFIVFKTFKERSRHVFETHRQRKACKECGKTYSSAHMLRTHVLNIHRSNPVECPICKRVVKKHYLKIHMKTHDDKSGDGAYCVECGITYKKKYIYEHHLKNSLKHNTIEKLGLKCDHCDEYFANKESLKNHVEKLGGVKYTCDICQKESKTKRGLTRHIQAMHEGKKPKRTPFAAVCEVCGKSFSLRKSLKEHLNVHLGIRPHVCKDCGATFTYSAALFTHRRLKHKVKRKFEMTS